MGTKQIPHLAKVARDTVLETFAEKDEIAANLAKKISYFDDLGQGILWTEAKKLNELDRHKLLVERAAGTEKAFLEFCLPFKPWENKVPEFDRQVKEKMEGKNEVSSESPDS